MKHLVKISAISALLLLVASNSWAANDQPIATEEQLEPLVGFDPFQETLLPLTSINVIKKDIWVRPALNISAADRFKECYGLPEREQIHALINTQIAFNEGGCKGIAFTDSGIYINNTVGSKTKGKFFIPYSLLYDDATIYSYKSGYGIFIINDIEIKVLPGYGEEGLSFIKDSFQLARSLSKLEEYRFVKTEEKERKIINDFPTEILDLWEEFKIDRLHVKPNIPSKLDKGFKKCNKISDDVVLLALIPVALTAKQSCNGVAFTNEGIFIKNAWMSDAKGRFFITYETFLEQDHVPHTYTNAWYVAVSPNISLDLVGAIYDRKEITNLFRSIRGDYMMADDAIEKALAAKKANKKINKKTGQDILTLALGLYIAKETVCDQPGKKPTINKALLGMNPEYRGGKKKHKSRVRRYNENVKKLKSDCERKKKKLALLGLLTQ